MATQGRGAPFKRKASIPTSDFAFPPVPVATPQPLKQDWELVMGWIAACLLIVVLLPLLGMLYIDVLQTKKEAQTQIEKMEKLRRQVEKEKRDDSNSRIPPR
jgi:predicted ATP-grasp superfamily ATP-dependent carboligase